MATFFTADPFLGQRPAEEVTRILDQWNATVAPTDTVWVLGGIGPMREVGSFAQIDTWRHLAGRRYLIAAPGDFTHWSHYDELPNDRYMIDTVRPRDAEYARDWCGFAGVADGRAVHEKGEPIVLPLRGGPLSFLTPVALAARPWRDPRRPDPYAPKRRRPTATRPGVPALLLHGGRDCEWIDNGDMLNVSLDMWGLTPVSAELVLEMVPRPTTEDV